MRSLTLLALLTLTVGCRTAAPLWHVEATSPQTLRTVTSGQLIGGDGRYDSHAWLGIPFAKPPVGPLRWRAPQPPEPWTGVRQAKAFGPACVQAANAMSGASSNEGVVGDEDCLTLSVWAPRFGPQDVPNKKLPVMVWIHGGGNSIGSAAFHDGGHLADEQQVLVVAIQYRLGPLGWFRHAALREGADPLDASGNFGTLDQVRALEWVRDNAAAFGGDPGNVTIFGESAGGFNVYALLVSPAARGLFHRAIAQSGYLGASTVEKAEAREADGGHHNSSAEVVARLLKSSGREGLAGAALATALRALTPAQLWAGYDNGQALGMLDAPLVFRDGAVLPAEEWLAVLGKTDGWNRVPFISGTNRDENRLFLFLDPERSTRVLGIFPRLRDEANFTATADTMSRFWKFGAVDEPLQAMAKAGATALYAYRWDWRGEPTVLGGDLSVMLGAAHALEVPFVFGHFDMGPLNLLFTKENEVGREALSKQMRQLWASFARDGVPGAPWTAFDAAGDTHLLLDVDAKGTTSAKMTPALDEPRRIIADLLTDPRLPTAKEKCGVLREMTQWGQSFTREQYGALEVCRAYPLEK
jgi:para-nitrobenzyl esterase